MTTRRRRAGAALAAVAGAGLAAAAPAWGHGIVGRADLPIPAGLFGAAAAVVLVVSFLVLAGSWSTPRLEPVPERRLFGLGVAVDAALGLAGIAAFAAVVYAGLAGTQVEQDNLAPTAVFVVLWVGVPVASLLLGDVFRLLSPWRALGRATGWVAQRVARDGVPEPLEYPERLGRWPAVIGIAGFAVCELCWAAGREPRTLAVLALAYLAVQAIGQSLYGVEVWSRRGDALGVYFGLFARLAPLARREGVLVIRPPVAGATGLDPVTGTLMLLFLAIGITAFDGAQQGPVFNDAAPGLQDALTGLGLSKGAALEWTFAAGLAVTVALVSAIYSAGVAGMPRPAGGGSAPGLGRRFAHSLIPIAAAYVVAHYFSLLAYNGQDALRLASDPLGDGSDLFGTASRSIDYGVVSATAIWYVQVASLVIGHVAALVLAHDRALIVYGDARAAVRSQFVMLVVMVCFTVLGLYLLSVANA